jgi:hypothetical protein
MRQLIENKNADENRYESDPRLHRARSGRWLQRDGTVPWIDTLKSLDI